MFLSKFLHLYRLANLQKKPREQYHIHSRYCPVRSRNAYVELQRSQVFSIIRLLQNRTAVFLFFDVAFVAILTDLDVVGFG